MPPVLAAYCCHLALVLLYARDLLDYAGGEPVDEADHLLPDAKDQVADILFPVLDGPWHQLILFYRALDQLLDLLKARLLFLVAMIHEVNLLFIDQALEAFVVLLLFVPEVKWHVVVRASQSTLSI